MSWKIREAAINKYKSLYLDVIGNYEKFDKFLEMYLKRIKSFSFEASHLVMFTNACLFYAVPSPTTIDILAKTFQTCLLKDSATRFIDFAAGKGVFSWLLHREIPTNQIVAVDIQEFEKTFWPIQKHITFQPSDILFLAWSHPNNALEIQKEIDHYIDIGGKCVIILGQFGGDLTYPCPKCFVDNEEWDVTSYSAETCLFENSDTLTINIRK